MLWLNITTNMGLLDTAINFFLNKTDNIKHIKTFWDEQSFNGNYSHTTKWNSTDNVNTFKLSGNKKYTTNSITYHINEHGYRIPQPLTYSQTTNEKQIACFGCSQTFGVGVAYEETWSHLLEAKLNNKFKVNNYGASGASCDSIARLVCCYLIKNKPSIICCMLPDMFRREIFETNSNGYPVNYNNLWSDDDLPLPVKCKKQNIDYMDWKAYKRLSGEDNSLFNFIKNVKFIESMCKANNIELYITTWDQHILSCIKQGEFVTDSFKGHFELKGHDILVQWKELEKARDNLHLGLQANEIYASLFYHNITNK